MIRRACAVAMVAAGLALSGPVGADGVDRLRCETLSVRKEGRLYDCFGRCQRRNSWRMVRLGSAADGKLAECRADCEHRYDAAMDQLEQGDICGAVPPERPASAAPRQPRDADRPVPPCCTSPPGVRQGDAQAAR